MEKERKNTDQRRKSSVTNKKDIYKGRNTEKTGGPASTEGTRRRSADLTEKDRTKTGKNTMQRRTAAQTDKKASRTTGDASRRRRSTASERRQSNEAYEKRNAPLTEDEKMRRERIRKRRQEAQKRRRRKVMIQLAALCIGIVVLLGVGIAAVVKTNQKKVETKKEAAQKEEEVKKDSSAVLDKAALLAAQYDYDAAIQCLQEADNATENEDIQKAISEYEATKETLVEVDPNEVTHVFYHSLVVDTNRGFEGTQGAQFNMWMTTVDEFNKINESMYERGYVLVRLRDLVKQTTDENGNVKFEQAKIMLPPGKKAFVLSLDDLSYYHSYDGYGIASKLIIGKDGKPTNEYIDADGNTLTGSYDCVPLLDDFVEEHPDFSYRGAKGIIALTGYNGILGYRTDQSYQDRPADLDQDKVDWLEAHPDFNLEEERKQAKAVADCMKEDGWEFASHTWGHQRIADISYEHLQTDTQKWLDNVAPLVGGTDTIIFAHGQDITPTGEYTTDDEKYNYLKSQGFNFYCNVDSSVYCTMIKEDYVHQGRRNLDGYRMYHNPEMVEDLFDAKAVFDKGRPTPVAEE